jgi:hypothetical protein
MTPALAQLSLDALSAGYSVDLGDYSLTIRVSLRGVAVKIFLTETGAFLSANRVDVPLELANNIPTIKGVRKALGLAA